MIDDEFLSQREEDNPIIEEFLGTEFDQPSLDVMGLLESGTAFDRSFQTTIGGVSSNVSDGVQVISTLGALLNPVDPVVAAKINAVGTTVNSVVANVGQFATHVADLFDSFPDRLQTFSSHQGLKNALAQAPQSCDEMATFFGSVTSTGRELISTIEATAAEVFQTINDFRALATELTTLVAETQQTIENVINAEIAATTDPSLIQTLNSWLTTAQTTFATSSPSERETFIDDLSGILSQGSMATINGIAGPMFDADVGLEALADTAESQAGTLSSQSSSLQGLVAGETAAMANAEDRLLKFAQASSLRSMFKGDACVNTLLGYVGSDNLLKKLF